MALFSFRRSKAQHDAPEPIVGFSDGRPGERRIGRLDIAEQGHRDAAEAARYARTYYPVLGIPAGVQAVRLICQTISSLPVCCVNSRGTEIPVPEWVKKPSKKVPELDFKAVLNHVVSSLVLNGIAYVGVRRGRHGDPMSLVLVEADSVNETMEVGTENRVFDVRRSTFASIIFSDRPNSHYWDRHVNGVGQRFADDNMLIWLGAVPVPGGLRGVSAFDLMHDTVSIARAVQNFAAEHYELYAHRPTVFQMRAGSMSEEKKEELEADIKERMTGKDRGVPKTIFTSGPPSQEISWEQVGDKPGEMSVAEISAFLMAQIGLGGDVPLAVLGGSTSGGNSYNSLQTQRLHWLKSTVLPMIHCVEKVFDRLLPEEHSLKLDTSELLKGDPLTTSKVAIDSVTKGVITIDEAREMMGYPPSGEEGASMLMVDGNRKPLEQAIQEPPEPPPMIAPGGAPDGGDLPENMPSSPESSGAQDGNDNARKE